MAELALRELKWTNAINGNASIQVQREMTLISKNGKLWTMNQARGIRHVIFSRFEKLSPEYAIRN